MNTTTASSHDTARRSSNLDTAALLEPEVSLRADASTSAARDKHRHHLGLCHMLCPASFKVRNCSRTQPPERSPGQNNDCTRRHVVPAGNASIRDRAKTAMVARD